MGLGQHMAMAGGIILSMAAMGAISADKPLQALGRI